MRSKKADSLILHPKWVVLDEIKLIPYYPMRKVIKAVCIGKHEATFTAKTGKDSGKDITRYYYDLLSADGQIYQISSKVNVAVEEHDVIDFVEDLARSFTLESVVANGKVVWRFA